MQALLHDHPRARIANCPIPPGKGMAWGFIGGLVATLVMDLVMMGIFVAAGMSPFTCFAIVGNTVASLLSLQELLSEGSIPLGLTAHYAVGPVMGGIFGAAAAKINATAKVDRFCVDTLKKSVVLAVLYAQILSQPLLALTPILLNMTASDTLEWFGGSFFMHLIWGCFLGVVWGWGIRLPIASSTK